VPLGDDWSASNGPKVEWILQKNAKIEIGLLVTVMEDSVSHKKILKSYVKDHPEPKPEAGSTGSTGEWHGFDGMSEVPSGAIVDAMSDKRHKGPTKSPKKRKSTDTADLVFADYSLDNINITMDEVPLTTGKSRKKTFLDDLVGIINNGLASGLSSHEPTEQTRAMEIKRFLLSMGLNFMIRAKVTLPVMLMDKEFKNKAKQPAASKPIDAYSMLREEIKKRSGTFNTMAASGLSIIDLGMGDDEDHEDDSGGAAAAAAAAAGSINVAAALADVLRGLKAKPSRTNPKQYLNSLEQGWDDSHRLSVIGCKTMKGFLSNSNLQFAVRMQKPYQLVFTHTATEIMTTEVPLKSDAMAAKIASVIAPIMFDVINPAWVDAARTVDAVMGLSTELPLEAKPFFNNIAEVNSLLTMRTTLLAVLSYILLCCSSFCRLCMFHFVDAASKIKQPGHA
jgi:hypothetical protein